MSENSSKSMKPPLSDEMKESKENSGKGVKTNANNSSGNPRIPRSEIYLDNPAVSNSSGNPSNPFTQNLNKDKSTYTIPKNVAVSPTQGFPATGGHRPYRGSQYGISTADHPIQREIVLS